MPELPEIETICRGLTSSILKQKIITVIIRNSKLRHPIPKNLPKILKGQYIQKINRRGKYILLQTKIGTLILHLGMSGNIQIKTKNYPIAKHEHFTIAFTNNLTLCYNDPRRFGAILWTNKNPSKHRLLKKLGLEPFDKNFTENFLYDFAKSKKYPIKQLLMNNTVVTGIGNIYANEILFAVKINPLQKANTLSKIHYQKIVKATKQILSLAIKYGGTTIRDHTDSSGRKGLFQNKLKVYGRASEPCIKCRTMLTTTKIGQRSTVFCHNCQKPFT